MEWRKYQPGLRFETWLGSIARGFAIIGDSIATKKTVELIDLFPAILPLVTQHLIINKLNDVNNGVNDFKQQNSLLNMQSRQTKLEVLNQKIKQLGTRIETHTITVNGTTALVMAGQTVNALSHIKNEGLDPFTALVPLGLFLFGSLLLFQADKRAHDRFNEMVDKINVYESECAEVNAQERLTYVSYPIVPAIVLRVFGKN